MGFILWHKLYQIIINNFFNLTKLYMKLSKEKVYYDFAIFSLFFDILKFFGQIFSFIFW